MMVAKLDAELGITWSVSERRLPANGELFLSDQIARNSHPAGEKAPAGNLSKRAPVDP
jgi:hypothetical protein